mgnify:CR=1 FL=1
MQTHPPNNMTYSIIPCLHCQTNFQVKSSEIRRGNGKFCSRECSSQFTKLSAVPKKPNLVCAYCTRPFYRSISKQKYSRSGLHFCSREHKDLAQRIGGVKEIQPSHYSDSPKSYRTVAFRCHLKQCSRCNFNQYEEVLEVHHKDRNKNNNHEDNLEILCPTCHSIEHFLAQDGKWKSKS